MLTFSLDIHSGRVNKNMSQLLTEKQSSSSSNFEGTNLQNKQKKKKSKKFVLNKVKTKQKIMKTKNT
ncbi:hypothetical protein Mgra_00008501 [Meloidogyne graminicola]|uniref:Uncharacterized protein n=1 Tax=Meloidogyne graminicola TaxID=189291 RepID=A0A8S9ZFF8_9BILA|nr:hypothetical protein Mgra_00008501 [Meloidogyne graminicola]